MNSPDLEKDYQYFKNLWEYHRPSGMKHTAQLWDQRAREWEKELATDNIFHQQLQMRVQHVAAFLRDRNLLQKDAAVADIGCGHGRFVVEFAKTAKYVTGIDFSAEMLQLGRKYGEECGITNISFEQCDFKTLDLVQQGWEKYFDLVFSSMSPATGNEAGLNKLIRMSKGFCFNCSPIDSQDSLEIELAQNVLGMDSFAKSLWDPRWFYSLFNILWLQGYLPETYYDVLETNQLVLVDEQLISYYTHFLARYAPEQKNIEKQVQDYLFSHADGQQQIQQQTKRTYGWILWDVRKNKRG